LRKERRSETFAFLGFTHYCGWAQNDRFIVKHKAQRERLTRKLKNVRAEARKIMHVPVAVQHRWLSSVLRGRYAYYGRPHNFPALAAFLREVQLIWLKSLRKRSQKNRKMSWDAFKELLQRFPLPNPRITHSWAACRLAT
jgi:RNA-directed DNA polymerase